MNLLQTGKNAKNMRMTSFRLYENYMGPSEHFRRVWLMLSSSLFRVVSVHVKVHRIRV